MLLNEYLPNQGIMPHQDGPAYFPVVAILSLRSPVVMDFSPHSRFRSCKNDSRNNVEPECSDEGSLDVGLAKSPNFYQPFSVLLMPCSLLIFKDNAYTDYLHGIADSEVQQYDEAVNIYEALHEGRLDQPVTSPEEAAEVNGNTKSIHRITNRISLTCRTVLKVHKNLFKI